MNSHSELRVMNLVR